MNRILVLFLTLGISSVSMGQGVIGARASALSGASATLDDNWSVLNNQAGMAYLNTFQAGISYESRFAMSELGDKALGLTLPVGRGAFGASFRSFGYSLYSDSRAGLAYAMRLDEKFSIGVQANYHMLRIAEGYGARQTVSVEGGVLYKMNKNLTLAAHVFNPTRAKIADYRDERIAGIIRTGLAYAFSDKVKLLGELRKVSDQKDVRIVGGIEYHIIKELAVRVSGGSNPTTTSFGLGWHFKSWKIDVASGYHAVLGFSPQLSLAFAPQKQAESKP